MILRDIPKGNARKFPDKTAIVFEDVRYSFKEFNDRINSLANALTDMGLRKGDRIAIVADNCNQIVEMFWVGVKTGVTTYIINPSLPQRDLSHLINNGGAKGMVFGHNYRSSIESLRPLLESVKEYIIIGDSERGFKNYEELVTSYSPSEPEIEVNEDDLLYLAATSGTTGLSKQPMHTYGSLWTTALIDLHAHDYDMREGGVSLLGAPLFWGYWVPRFSIHCFYMSCPVVIPRDITPQCLLQTIERERVTNLATGTAFLHELMNHPNLNKYDHSSLRRVFVFGYLPPEVWRRATELFGNIFLLCYGLSEIGTISYLPPKEFIFEGPPEKTNRMNSCGKEAIGVEVRVIGEEGNDVQPGEVGEVIARGDDMMKGYLNAPRATEETIREGYIYTGDLATLDENGYIYLKGRKKDVITTQGKMVMPSEIEEVISLHPQVLEVAAIGIPDEELGEAIKVVVIKGEGKVTEEELIELCQHNLPAYAVPKSVDFVQSLPKTPSGRIQRYKVRAEYIQPK